MSIRKVTIGEIKCLDEVDGKYGPQRKIAFLDSNGVFMSGWVAEDKFVGATWVNGGQVTLEIIKNGKYTNFKLVPEGAAEVEEAETGDVWTAIKAIHKLIDLADKRITALESGTKTDKDVF